MSAEQLELRKLQLRISMARLLGKGGFFIKVYQQRYLKALCLKVWTKNKMEIVANISFWHLPVCFQPRI
tara:strand:+ start:708 stop:914 length:207 start_codon:yes stop_codon:yes gene_type:complete